MTPIDYAVIVVYSIIVLVIGYFATRRTKSVADYFAGGWKVPWWLSAVSHHVSGYSAFAFVAYAGIAYRYGFTIYTIWALTISIGLLIGALIFAPRWGALGKKGVLSPLQYLEERFNLPTRVGIAVSFTSIKFIDLGLKIFSLAVFLNAFVGLDIVWSIIVAGVVTIAYMVTGGILASIWTDFAQAIIQFIPTIILFIVALQAVGGFGGLISKAPPGFWQPLSGPYDFWYWLAFLIVVTLSYCGATLNLAQRFISVGAAKEARKVALLSAILYLTYPVVMFVPMWVARVLYPNLDKPDYAYAVIARDFLPKIAPGLLGFMLAGLFAATMSMIDSDLNSLSVVFTIDLYGRLKKVSDEKKLLKIAQIITLVFGIIMIIASFIPLVLPQAGGIFNIMVDWYAGLLGPIGIPLLLGLVYKYTTWRGAIASWAGGFIVWAIFKYGLKTPWTITTWAELITSFVIFFLEPMITRKIAKIGIEEIKRIEEFFEGL
jgi:SSS family solute:Na+ symporter